MIASQRMRRGAVEVAVLLACALLLTSCTAQTNIEDTKVESLPVVIVPQESTEPEPPEHSDPFALDSAIPTVDRVCTGEEGTDSEVVDAVNLTLLTLPRWLRTVFIDSGWEMHVVPYDIATTDYSEQFSEGKVYGSTAYSNHLIKIQNELAATAMSPIHEVGHWFDAQLGYPTLYSDEFALLFEEEGEVYRQTFGPTCTWSIHEFIAEGFWCYWQSPVALQKACPTLYGFIENGLSQLETATLQ